MKENKSVYYIALAIGGAFLIHYIMMNYKKADKVSNPANPGTSPLPVNPVQAFTQPIIKAMALTEIAQSQVNENALTNQHSNNEYNTSSTYQNYYGRTIGQMNPGCPTVI